MHEQRQDTPEAPTSGAAPARPATTHRADPLLDGAGSMSRALEPRFASTPPIVPLFAIVVVGYIGMVAALVGIGELIVHLGVLAGLRDWDEAASRWLADHRSGFLDSVTGFLSRAADTMGIIALALVLEIVLLVQRRWWALLIAPIALGLELVTFLTVNAVVGRPRPDVAKLGSEPSTSSFPSGHTAATVVFWGAVALLFFSASTSRWVRSTAYAVVFVLAVAVGSARAYRGMHHPTDVVLGALMGLTALSITVLAVRVTALRVQARHHEPGAAPATRPSGQVPAVSA
jgi:membrane-associated phospholipid phosphatase